jgi:hypothetical protein
MLGSRTAIAKRVADQPVAREPPGSAEAACRAMIQSGDARTDQSRR